MYSAGSHNDQCFIRVTSKNNTVNMRSLHENVVLVFLGAE